MSRRMPSDLKNNPTEMTSRLKLDLISILAGINVVIISFWLYTQIIDQDLVLADKIRLAPEFLGIGLVFGICFRMFSPKMFQLMYSAWDFLKLTLGTVVSIVMIIGVQIATKAAFPTLSAANGATLGDLQTRLFYGNQGIAEEFFFNFFVFTAALWFLQRLKVGFLAPVFALALTGFAFFLYHIAVYGWNPALMIFTMSARIILSASYLLTGELGSPALSHFIINFMVA